MKLVPVLNVYRRSILSPKQRTESVERIVRTCMRTGKWEILLDTVEIRHRRRITPKYLVRLET